ncbi:molybdenum cofactor biosynthesis protein MoaE [Stieleria sp. TO1_6]|uniref:molybdenum cofactor biosynthesis protein MoaE n=1 Tax=Stieleria tagensis TaxID=2956795 RepID=UPI00209B0338|nr:molybdenum cofactor biosynthesis protein MoaE [Stieleria tagensis]MCO8124303.1 molybdenum cofactor biosynthesis protein MoaE [Stieleria tagensis]
MIQIELVDSPIHLADWESSLHDVDTGAHAWFAGVTRRTTADGSGGVQITQTLHYEAHRPMAIDQLQQLAQQARRQHSLTGVVIVHRLGEVSLGQASVLVGCSSPHRIDVFAALPWIMDRLKADVPIWKRETFADDSTQWVHPDAQ